MAEANKPPPYQTLLAAAAGGFGGALLGVVAATNMMGDGDNGSSNADPQIGMNDVEVVETKVASRE
jgi:hypothetical protein